MNIKKNITFFLVVVISLLITTSPAFAHVVVKPSQVGVGERLNFVVSVPTEKDDPTVELRLIIPEGLQSVRPNVKPGWKIQIKKSGEGEEARVAEITWSDGTIPTEQRDEFVFSAQAPANETNLVWKAYQTYGHGDVVAWENDPKMVEEYTKNNPPKEGQEDDHNAPRPYSQTKVVNDLAPSSDDKIAGNEGGQNNNAIFLSVIALFLSLVSLGMQFYKKK